MTLDEEGKVIDCDPLDAHWQLYTNWLLIFKSMPDKAPYLMDAIIRARFGDELKGEDVYLDALAKDIAETIKKAQIEYLNKSLKAKGREAKKKEEKAETEQKKSTKRAEKEQKKSREEAQKKHNYNYYYNDNDNYKYNYSPNGESMREEMSFICSSDPVPPPSDDDDPMLGMFGGNDEDY